MAEYKQLKYYFDKELAELLANKICSLIPNFNQSSFVKEVDSGVQEFELKGRVEVISDALRRYLPDNYTEAMTILLAILGPENENETGMFTEGYWLMPIASFVEKYGLDDFDLSMKAIYEITKRNTGEYAIRPFLNQYPQKTLEIMRKWSKDPNFHVRRLASEGLRSRLPWAKKLTLFIDDPSPVIAILENLKSDSSAFVRKSVANNLNDLLKDNYPSTIAVIKRWNQGASKETKWIIKHALRNEIKNKNKEALELIS